MRHEQGAVLTTLRAIQGFLGDNKDTVAPVNESGARKSLDALAQQLAEQAVDQDAGRVRSRGETSLQSALRTTLLQFHMKPIAAVAQARLRDTPEMRSFTLPQARTSSVRLVAMAGGMADAAAKHAAVFIERGLAPDFITQLTSAADALTQSLDTRAKSRGRWVGATTALAALTSQALASIRELDALVVPKVAGDERLLGEWRTTKHVRRKNRPLVASTTTPVASGSATTAPSTATVATT